MIPEYVKQEARKELARRELFNYCKLKHPDFYKEDRTYLKEMCNEIQSFLEQEQKMLFQDIWLFYLVQNHTEHKFNVK